MKLSLHSIAVRRTLPALAVVIALAAPPTALANPDTILAAQLTRQMVFAGPQSGAYVYDLSSSTPLFAERSDVPRPPASVEKIYTATTALQLLGPEARFTTSVLGTGHLGPAGRWEGNLYLRGGGDPTFGSSWFIANHYGGLGSSVSTLARRLVKAGIRNVSGGVYGDESYFDSLRGEPASGYRLDPDLEGALSALSFNRGESGHERGSHSLAAFAARQLRAVLAADGVHTHRGGAATTPRQANVLARLKSPPLRTLLGLTLPPSDNFFAETLLKDIGARFGGAGSTSAGVKVVQRVISGYGIHAHILDGSGLSHSDATTPRQVVSLLADLATKPIGTTLRNDMAVAGQTGTLEDRMRGTPAAGRCQGKTGTLVGVSNLAGYCTAANGDVLAFAFFTDGIETARAHTIQDAMAITLARY